MKLENSFEVPASREAVWKVLNDVPRIIPCMPGAELTETISENEWRGKMAVKLGPIALQFGTEITREQAEEKTYQGRLHVKARELRGRGGATATVESSLAESAAGTTVTIVTDLALSGTVAQYGRGIVADVAGLLTSSFASCIAIQLADAPEEEKQAAVAAQAKAIPGLRLGLGALWRSLRRLLIRR
jgi:carbon monoxide dehydrogenase subunit G